jgi:hypothetical protein
MRRWWKIALALAAAVPAVAFRFSAAELEPAVAIAVFGGAVVASAFLLVWAGEAAHHDISGSLATLFAVQFPFPQTGVRLLLSAVYAAIALAVIVRRRGHLPALLRETFAGFS